MKVILFVWFSVRCAPFVVSVPSDVVGTYSHVSANHGKQNHCHTRSKYNSLVLD